jgi:hypothetical protein
LLATKNKLKLFDLVWLFSLSPDFQKKILKIKPHPPGSPKNYDGIGSLYKLQEALILII